MKGLNMRVKYLIPFLVLVLIFGLIGCTALKEDNGIKYGLTEIQKQQAFYELCVLQDSIAVDDPPDRSEKMEEAYLIIAKKYDITKDEMIQITAEGIEKNWPFPPLK